MLLSGVTKTTSFLQETLNFPQEGNGS